MTVATNTTSMTDAMIAIITAANTKKAASQPNQVKGGKTTKTKRSIRRINRQSRKMVCHDLENRPETFEGISSELIDQAHASVDTGTYSQIQCEQTTTGDHEFYYWFCGLKNNEVKSFRFGITQQTAQSLIDHDASLPEDEDNNFAIIAA